MNNEETLINDCQKDKKLFFSYLMTLVFATVILLIIGIIFYVEKKNKQRIYDSFVNGDEIICKNFIVSKNLGFKFDENSKNRISDGKNTFIIYNCISK